MGAPIEQDLAERELLPGTHLLDSGYVVADLLVNAPARASNRCGGTCPERRQAVKSEKAWATTCTPSRSIGKPIRRSVPRDIAVSNGHRATVQRAMPSSASDLTKRPVTRVPCAPPVRLRQDTARQITVKPQAQHEAIEAARRRQATPEFKAQYALRAGVESTLSQGARRFDLRRSRYIGLARTHLQQTINATAMNVVRVAHWLWGKPVGEHKRKAGHFARLASTVTH